MSELDIGHEISIPCGQQPHSSDEESHHEANRDHAEGTPPHQSPAQDVGGMYTSNAHWVASTPREAFIPPYKGLTSGKKGASAPDHLKGKSVKRKPASTDPPAAKPLAGAAPPNMAPNLLPPMGLGPFPGPTPPMWFPPPPMMMPPMFNPWNLLPQTTLGWQFGFENPLTAPNGPPRLVI